MKKIVILHSDISAEASEDELDCLRQAEAISGAARVLGYEPILLPFVLDLNQTIKELKTINPFAVFNIVETLSGRGSLIHLAPALLDYLKIPYTGCPTDAIFVTSNKPLAKKFLRSSGIATPDWLEMDDSFFQESSNEKYLIKSSWEHASVGLDENSLISHKSNNDLLAQMNRRQELLGGSCFAEAYIDGREFNVALIAEASGVRVLPIAEMIFRDYAEDKPKLVDYRAKWVADSFEYNNTIRKYEFEARDDKLLKSLQEISLRCWKLFGLRGYARVDFRVDKSGKPWVLEINTNPCLSPDAGFAAALEQASLKYHEAIALIIQDALK
ncbi:MAG: ATP-grasp domain-containing protein [Syntrophaceae bacterium]|nr:ATP-grasp domain-containing protein [Syntrophaceae bacterium]